MAAVKDAALCLMLLAAVAAGGNLGDDGRYVVALFALMASVAVIVIALVDR